MGGGGSGPGMQSGLLSSLKLSPFDLCLKVSHFFLKPMRRVQLDCLVMSHSIL